MPIQIKKNIDKSMYAEVCRCFVVGAKEPKLLEAITAGQKDWAGTAAVKAGRVTELTGPAWYLGEGGVYSMDRMLTDVEKALGL